jgi:quinolinate synthetase A
MANMETATFDTELSLFKYDNLEQLPASHRDLTEAEREPRIEAALDELGDSVVILGHNYQRREIVEHADFIGDSYALSKHAAEADAEYVIFGGVTFMAESADIITDDDQSVVLPCMEASCPMAGMAEALQVDAAWEQITNADPDSEIIPITYMNSYADLKAFCAEQGGLVCTSSNAHKAFEWAFERGDKVLFLPDKHLGENTAHRLDMEDSIAEWNPWDPEAKDADELEDADIVLWDGYCQVHERGSPPTTSPTYASDTQTPMWSSTPSVAARSSKPPMSSARPRRSPKPSRRPTPARRGPSAPRFTSPNISTAGTTT